MQKFIAKLKELDLVVDDMVVIEDELYFLVDEPTITSEFYMHLGKVIGSTKIVNVKKSSIRKKLWAEDWKSSKVQIPNLVYKLIKVAKQPKHSTKHPTKYSDEFTDKMVEYLKEGDLEQDCIYLAKDTNHKFIPHIFVGEYRRQRNISVKNLTDHFELAKIQVLNNPACIFNRHYVIEHDDVRSVWRIVRHYSKNYKEEIRLELVTIYPLSNTLSDTQSNLIDSLTKLHELGTYIYPQTELPLDIIKSWAIIYDKGDDKVREKLLEMVAKSSNLTKQQFLTKLDRMNSVYIHDEQVNNMLDGHKIA